jgi:hypothetical protein
MAEKLIPATQLAEYVYCSQAWHLNLHGAQVSAETRGIQAQANAWHEEQGKRGSLLIYRVLSHGLVMLDDNYQLSTLVFRLDHDWRPGVSDPREAI